MKEAWTPMLIGNKVYAIRSSTGTRREMRMTDGWTVASVSGMGDSITVCYTNGRVRQWNPTTDSVQTVQ
jgi:hypothetical protein